MNLNANKTGLAVGAAFGLFHLIWSVLVALGWGQVIYDFILWAHMVHLQFTVGPFDAVACITLIIMTSIIGYVVGYVFALIWNKVHPA